MKKVKSIYKFRYEHFGGIVSSSRPPFIAYISKKFAKLIGYNNSPLWDSNKQYLSAPTEVHFSITNKCSMGCGHCYMDSKEKMDNELTTAQLKERLDLLSQKNVFHIAMGGGEAFERDDLFEIANYARQVGIVPNLTTNGMYITEDNAAYCKVFGQINISVDYGSERASTMRMDNSFNIALRAIRILKKHKIKVGINSVFTRDTMRYIDELFLFAKKEKLSEIEFLRFKPSGRGKEQYQKLKTTHDQNKQIYPLLLSLASHHRVTTKIDCSFIPMICYHNPNKRQLKKFAAHGCEAGNILLGIKSDGTVSPCSFSPDIEFTIDEFDKFWDSSEILNAYRNWHLKAEEPCRSCDYLDLCKGGCHPVAVFEGKSFYHGDPACPFVRQYYEKTAALKEQRSKL